MDQIQVNPLWATAAASVWPPGLGCRQWIVQTRSAFPAGRRPAGCRRLCCLPLRHPEATGPSCWAAYTSTLRLIDSDSAPATRPASWCRFPKILAPPLHAATRSVPVTAARAVLCNSAASLHFGAGRVLSLPHSRLQRPFRVRTICRVRFHTPGGLDKGVSVLCC